MKNKRLILLPVLILFAISFILPALASPLEAVDDDYTKLLLHFDGDDASTAILDESGKTTTVYGNAQLDTAQYKFGNASMLLDGTGDYITYGDSDDFILGSNDFTIDLWVRFNALPLNDVYQAFFGQHTDSNNYIYFVIGNSSGTYYYSLICRDAGTFTHNINIVTTISTQTWYHVALVKASNVISVYQDGVLVNSVNNSYAIPDKTGAFMIGNRPTSTYYLNGWIDEFRFSNGIARWTSNFTPPTEYYFPTPTPTVATSTATYTPTNTPITITDTPTPRPPYAEATAYLESQITYGDIAVTLSVAGMCLLVLLALLIAFGLYIGTRKKSR